MKTQKFVVEVGESVLCNVLANAVKDSFFEGSPPARAAEKQMFESVTAFIKSKAGKALIADLVTKELKSGGFIAAALPYLFEDGELDSLIKKSIIAEIKKRAKKAGTK